MKSWKLGHRDTIRAFAIQNKTVVIITGKKPQGCEGPKLFKSDDQILTLRCLCSDPCLHVGEKSDNYFLVEPIDQSGGEIFLEIIHFSFSGRDQTVVENLVLDQASLESIGESKFQSAHWAAGAIGISQDFSLEDAFKDALHKFDPAMQQEPSLVQVVSMGALYGGFAGFSRLFVKVESSFSERHVEASDSASSRRLRR